MKKKYVFVFLIFLIFCFLYPNQATKAQDEKNVLFLSSYDDQDDLVEGQISGLLNVFMEEDVRLDTEFMDTKQFDTEENIQLFQNILKYKINNVDPYDVIIAGDDNALQFVIDNQEELFLDVPVIFIGINDFERAKTAANDPYITGIRQYVSMEDTLNLAVKINPNAKKVVALTDGSLTGMGDQNQFYSIKDDFPQLSFSHLDASVYSFEEIGSELEKIQEDTIVLQLNMNMDRLGESRTTDEVAKFVTKHLMVPVYRISSGGIGSGALGGKRISFVQTGEMAAGMAIDIIKGRSVSEIDLVMESPYEILFDYEVMKKFGVNEELLPKDTMFINKEPNFFEENYAMLINILIVFLILILLITLATMDNIRRRRSNIRLSRALEDVSQAEEELRAQYDTIQKYIKEIEILNKKYELSIQATSSAVWEIDLDTDEVFVSSEFNKLLAKDDLNNFHVNTSGKIIFEEKIMKKIQEDYAIVKNGKKEEIDVQVSIDIGNMNKWFLIRGKGIYNSEKNMQMLYGIILDITGVKEQEQYIEKMAKHDYLTSLPNRFYFMNRIFEEIEKNNPFSILILDIDNFKEINDTLGHMYGDKILTMFAKRLVDSQKEDVFISRFGGDEFAVLLQDANDINVIERGIQEFNREFKRVISLNNIDNYISFSVGISRYPMDGQTPEELIMNADTAMYHVKNSGKNSHAYYNDEMKKDLMKKNEIENILRKAIIEDGFYLVFQPQVSVKTGEISSLEGLVRLKNSDLGPATFIQVAEETDQIIDIGRLVLRKAVEQLVYWKNNDFPMKTISINFSTKQLRDFDFVLYLKEILKKNDIPPKYIEIEITESILLENNEKAIRFLEELVETGVSLALDDFGTGFSSINYLTFIPLKKVKLDKSLNDKFLVLENLKVINSIISLVHGFELEITAEGIEEEEQFIKLKKAKCDYIQGYYFCKPLPAYEIEKIIRKKFFD